MSDTPLTFDGSQQSHGAQRPRLIQTAPEKRNADSRTLLTYWNDMRAGLDLPYRSDIDPRGIVGMLSQTFILERIAPGLARFRVGGSNFSDLMGMDVRGMPLSAIFNPQSRQDLARNLEGVFEMPGILRAALVSPRGLRRPELNAEFLVLPLRDNDGQVTRAIGCLLARGDVGKAPRRFDFRHVRVDPVNVVPAPATRTSERLQGHPLMHSLTQAETVTAIKPKFEPLKPGQPSYLRVVSID